MPFTSEGRLPPEAVTHLHIVIPAQAATVQVHGREVQDDLGKARRGEERGYNVPTLDLPLAGVRANHHRES